MRLDCSDQGCVILALKDKIRWLIREAIYDKRNGFGCERLWINLAKDYARALRHFQQARFQ